MKSIYLNLLVLILVGTPLISCDQIKENEKYSFNLISNATNFNSSTDRTYEGLVMGFSIYNKDGKIGKGEGCLIYKDGTIAADKLAKKLYPTEKRPGRYFIDDLFNKDSVNPKVDTTMLKDFDIYLYLIDTKFLELRLNSDGEGAGKTYSYYEKYPLDAIIYKQKAGKNFFVKCDSFHIENEDENPKWIKHYSNFIKKIALESNL